MNYVGTSNNNDMHDRYIRHNYKNANIPMQTQAIDLKWPETYIWTTKKTSGEIVYTLQQIIDMSRAETAEERASAKEGVFVGHHFDD